MRRWALVGGMVTLAVLVGIVAFGTLLGNTACASLAASRPDERPAPTPSAPPIALDEARVRQEAPQLATLLDRAVDEGHAEERHAGTARAMHAYLKAAGAQGGFVEWRGVVLWTILSVC